MTEYSSYKDLDDLRKFQELYNLANQEKDQHNLGKYWYVQALRNLGRLDEALNYANSVRNNFIDSEELTPQFLNTLGAIHHLKGNLGYAIEYYHQTKHLLSAKLNFSNEMGKVVYNIGLIYFQQGEIERSLKEIESSYQIFDSTENMGGKGRILNMLGMLHEELGNTTKMFEYYSLSLQIKEREQNPSQIAVTLLNLGLAYLQEANEEEANKIQKKLNELNREYDNREIDVRARFLKAAGLEYSGRMKEGLDAMNIYESLIKDTEMIPLNF